MIDTCGGCHSPMLSGRCLVCGGSQKLAQSSGEKVKKRNRWGKRRPQSSPKVPNGPVPDRVRPSKQGGDTSLMAWVGYNTRKDTSVEYRRLALQNLIDAELEPTSKNRVHIESFGEPGSRQRIDMIALQLKKQVQSQYHVFEGHQLWPSKQKKNSDIEWLKLMEV